MIEPLCPLWVDGIGYVQINFGEEPRFDADYDTGFVERELTVTGSRTIPRYGSEGSQWGTVLVGSTEKSELELVFHLPWPWRVSEQQGQLMQYRNWRRFSECLSSDGMNEAMIVAEDVLRDSEGRLLLLSATDVPVGADGLILLAPELSTELSAYWESIGCASQQPGDSLPLEPGAIRMEFVDGSSVRVAAGEQVEVVLAGDSYILAVATASSRSKDARCGSSVWALMRRDFLREDAAGP